MHLRDIRVMNAQRCDAGGSAVEADVVAPPVVPIAV
jgi:hypothetical protein